MSEETADRMIGVITGSSSGIGLAIAEHLLQEQENLKLIGLSRRPGPLESHPRFSHWETDLSDLLQTEKRVRRFCAEEKSCQLLVHAAGRGFFRPSTDWNSEELGQLMNLNLTSALMLAGGLTQKLRKGQGLAVFLGSTSGRERAPIGAAYAASKAGLHRFSESYFQENRKHGVRVLHLCSGMTQTPFYENEKFQPAEGECYSLCPKTLAELVYFFFQGAGKNTNPTHLVVEPKKVGVEKKKSP